MHKANIDKERRLFEVLLSLPRTLVADLEIKAEGAGKDPSSDTTASMTRAEVKLQ